MHMPEMSGYEMINAVSNLTSGLKYVVMTGDPGIQSEYSEKACMYLCKPLDPEKLYKVLHCCPVKDFAVIK